MILVKAKEFYSHNRANQRFYRVLKGRYIIKLCYAFVGKKTLLGPAKELA